MSILLWVLVIISVIGVIALFFKIIPFNEPPESRYMQELQNAVSEQQGFCVGSNCNGTAISCPDPNQLCRGQCLLYETLSIEPDVVDALTPIGMLGDPNIPPNLQCLDGFTQALSKRRAVCGADKCIGRDGREYNRGEAEEFYLPCGSLSKCDSNNPRAAVALNYENVQNTSIISPNTRCIQASVDPITGDATYIAASCPTTSQLENSESFLNLSVAPDGKYLIRAPGTGNCLSQQNGDIISRPCSEAGFEWFYLQSPLTIPGFSVPVTRRYPPQYILATASNFETELENINNLIKNLVTDFSTYASELKKIPTQQRNFVNSYVANILDHSFRDGNCSEITQGISNIRGEIDLINSPSINKRVISTFELSIKIAQQVIDIYQLIGPCRTDLKTLSFRGSELVLINLVSCPGYTDSGAPPTCSLNTVNINIFAYNCNV